MKEADFYKSISEKRTHCQLCRHECKINEGRLGICGVRKNIKGKLFSLVYGYPAAINVDPIEKKPIFHFQPGSFSYSIGTLGCNLICANCQNFNISQAKNIEEKLKNSVYYEPKKIVKEAILNNCSSISYTYNEPTIFSEYALDIMKSAQKNNLKNIWVSNGFMGKNCLEKIIPYLDAINIDLKSMDDNFYKKICGAKLKPILENLIQLKKKGIHLEITSLIIPGLNDDKNNLKKIASFIYKLDSKIPWHISKFFPKISWKLKNLTISKDQILNKAYKIGKEAGLKYVYLGNVTENEKENTFCPNCGQLIIDRTTCQVKIFYHNKFCPKCNTDLDIVF